MQLLDGAKILESQVVNKTSQLLVKSALSNSNPNDADAREGEGGASTAPAEGGGSGSSRLSPFTALAPFNQMWEIGRITAAVEPTNKVHEVLAPFGRK